jgi:NTP pyrophosphatase (non-canonical NTP hydrolase)
MRKIIDRLREFREARSWQKYHKPEALARATMIEAGELNELFLWGRNPSKGEVSDEVADVMIYCLNLCDVMGIDPATAINNKIDKNEVKYAKV